MDYANVCHTEEHPQSAEFNKKLNCGQAPVAPGTAAISPSAAPTSGVIEDGFFTDIASAPPGGQALVAPGTVAISPSMVPTSGVIEDGVLSNVASAPPVAAAFLPEHFVPIALAPLNYNGKFGLEDHREKEKSNTEGANDCGCHEPQVVPVVVEPQPTPSNNNSASFSFPPFTIVGPVGFIIIVIAIYFFYRMFTSTGNQQQGSSSTTQPSPNTSAPLADTHVISV